MSHTDEGISGEQVDGDAEEVRLTSLALPKCIFLMATICPVCIKLVQPFRML